MTHAEQRRLIGDLKDYVHRMSRSDEELFTMMVKRDKDDEDLDVLSMKRLRDMIERYIVQRGRRP